MSALCAKVTYLDDSFRENISSTVLGFLRQIEGLTIIDLKGADESRCRVITTLIHGNEPSGFIALHHLLNSGIQPATNMRLIICNPEAAQSKPIFTNRYLNDHDDLNRFFNQASNKADEVSIRAQQIENAVREVSPESIIDLHNTSGTSPAFGVALSEDPKTLSIVSLFASRIILTGLHVGAIMEVNFEAPIATIECGGANELQSHELAKQGLQKYFCQSNLFESDNQPVQVHRDPLRVQLINDASVGFSHNQLPTTDITLRADVELLNQQYTPKGEFLGWCSSENPIPLRAVDEKGQDRIAEIIECHNGCLFAKQQIQLFMVTTSSKIATNDCLFYATIQ